MNVFVIHLYFITSVSPVRAGKQTPVIVDVQKKILNIITNTRRCFVSLSVCAYIKLVIIRSYLYCAFTYPRDLTTSGIYFLSPPTVRKDTLSLSLVNLILGTLLTLSWGLNFAHTLLIHFQHSLTPCPHGCLTSPCVGVPKPLKYSAADARLTHWVCQSVQWGKQSRAAHADENMRLSRTISTPDIEKQRVRLSVSWSAVADLGEKSFRRWQKLRRFGRLLSIQLFVEDAWFTCAGPKAKIAWKVRDFHW